MDPVLGPYRAEKGSNFAPTANGNLAASSVDGEDQFVRAKCSGKLLRESGVDGASESRLSENHSLCAAVSTRVRLRLSVCAANLTGKSLHKKVN